MTIFNITDLNRRMDSAVEVLRKEYAGLRTGRASVSLLDPIVVDAYGAKMPLNQVATVSAPEARLLTVQVWDGGMSKAVEKAIRDSGLGLNPAAEGTMIRVPLPELSQERRTEMVKIASKYAENARVSVRNVRRDGMDALKKQQKDGDISEDEQAKLSKDLQAATDKHIKTIDDMLADKEKDIMQV
jgi:ribosome recycling factor